MIYYKKGYKYQLTRTATLQTTFRPLQDLHTKFITLYKSGLLEIRAGYAWDGPSGPTFDTPSFMFGSLFHDALYQLVRMGLLPSTGWRKADEVLSSVCLAAGMFKLRVKWIMAGLKLASGRAAHKRNLKKEYEAP